MLSQAVENEQYDRCPDECKGYRICLLEGFVIDKHADKQLERRINIHKYAGGYDRRFLYALCKQHERN